jgi:predicted transcriptional regulator
MSRTTLELDDDLLQALKQVALNQKEPMTRLANRLLRAALQPAPAHKVELQVFDLGRAHVALDNVADALAIAEGEDWR